MGAARKRVAPLLCIAPGLHVPLLLGTLKVFGYLEGRNTSQELFLLFLLNVIIQQSTYLRLVPSAFALEKI